MRDDAESQAQQLESGQFKVYSVAIDGGQVDCTNGRAKVFRELARDLDIAMHFAGKQGPTP